MSKKSKWLIGIIITAAILVVAGLVGWWSYDKQKYQSWVDQPSDVKKWEADPRPLQKEATISKQFKKIANDATNQENANHDSKRAGKLVTIPGLRGAWSIDYKTKQAAFGTDWVPQGVTQSNKNYYISVYDGDHKLNSLIFQVDKKTGKYVKSLILESKAHVGGIVYDRDRDRLIYSDDNKKGAGFGYISKEAIDEYQASEMQKPIAMKKIPWKIGSRTSAITLYNNQLVIAKYGKNAGERSVIAIPLDKDGLPKAVTEAELDKLAEKMYKEGKSLDDYKTVMGALIGDGLVNSYHPGWNRLQGVAISKSGITLLAQSNGEAPGKVWVQIPSSGGSSKLKFSAPTEGARVINVPHSVEEVSINPEETELALIFESGAKKYRETGSFLDRPTFMDRLLILPLTISDSDEK